MTSASTVTVNGSGNRSPVKEKEREVERETEETQQAGHSPSRFTAVNGRDTNMTGPNGNGHPGLVNGSGGGSGSGNENGGGDGDGNGNGKGNRRDERPDSRDAAKASFPDHDHDHDHEHARGTAHGPPSETANGSSPPYPHPPQHQPPPERSSHRSTADERERGHSSTTQLPPPRMSSSPHKRKRSYSQDRHQISTPTSFHRHSLPKSPPSSNYPRLDDENDDRTSSNGTWNGEYDTGGPHHTPNRHSLDASDAQLAEALQRNNQEQDARQHHGWPIRPEDETGPDSQHFTSYTSDQRSSQGVHVGAKRKRVFSNRTKTGCMTCRRRKKKCDEGQPQCNNCTRGGFTCEGYTSRNTWQKPSNPKGPIPLQSKDGYQEIHGQNLTTQEMSPVHTHHRHSMHHSDGSSIQPILVDDRDQMRQPYVTSPTAPTPHSQSGWGKMWPPTSSNPPQPPQAPHPHIQERTRNDYRDIPPITELTHQPPRSEYTMMPPIQELSRGPPSKSLYQQGPNQRSDYGSVSRLDMSDAQAQAHQVNAKLALEHSKAISHRQSHYDEPPEKEKMQRGEPYRPHDPALTDERERCKFALYRFNNACNPVNGFTPNEQRRLLRDLINPSRPVVESPSSTSSVPIGAVAPDCLVEAPFSCQYGYNISIASQVHISEGCRIIDARPVSIGAKTWIGPGVTIQTTMPDPHFGQRKGKDSPWLARPVTIGDMCWIGPGAVIMPGVHIQTGAYVAANEVVKKDVIGFGPPAWRFD